MAKQKVNINNTSIKSTVTNDPKKAICEYIWAQSEKPVVFMHIVS